MRLPITDEDSDTEYYVEQSAFESDDKLIIALDFGTTFSGIGYAFANEDKPDIYSIEDWPGSLSNLFILSPILCSPCLFFAFSQPPSLSNSSSLSFLSPSKIIAIPLLTKLRTRATQAAQSTHSNLLRPRKRDRIHMGCPISQV